MIKEISQEEIEKILPHRGKALLIHRESRVIYDSTDPDKLLLHKYVAIDDPVFEGHFPSKPLYRGVDLIECCAQASIVLAYQKFFKNSDFKGIPVFRGITGPVDFMRPIGPGEFIQIEVEYVAAITEMRRDFFVFNAQVLKIDVVDKKLGKLAAIINGITGTIVEIQNKK